MRIAFVSQPLTRVLPPLNDSLGMWTYEVARRLAFSCNVIVYGGTNRSWTKYVYRNGVHYRFKSLTLDEWYVKFLRRIARFRTPKRPLFASSLYYLGYILKIAYDLRRQHCDIIHVINFSQFVSIIRAFNPKSKIVLNMRCEWLTQLHSPVIQNRLRHADMVISCSEYITEKIRRKFPEFAHRCQTVFNGTDVDSFIDGRGIQSETKMNGAKRILFVGRVSPEKGVHVLLDAFQQVVEHYPEAQLEIVGQKAQLPFEYLVALSEDHKVSDLAKFYDSRSRFCYFYHLQNRLRSLNIASHVTFSDPVPHLELVSRYRDADVFIFPSVWNEPFGVPPVEAMAVGVPVIASRSGGIVETVEDGETGLLVEPGDEPALAHAILRLLSDEGLRKSMGTAGRKRAVELFSFDRVVDSLLCHYKNICHTNV